MNMSYTEPELFPETTDVTVDIKIGCSQEGERLGLWIQIRRKSLRMPVSESVTWHHMSHNGFASALDRIIEMMRETEEYHGLQLDALEVERDPAPF